MEKYSIENLINNYSEEELFEALLIVSDKDLADIMLLEDNRLLKMVENQKCS